VRRDRDREERDDIYQTLSTLWWGVLEPDANPYTMAQREIEPHMWINPGSMLLTEMNPVSAFSRNGFNLKVELSRELDVPRTVRLAADHSEVAWTSNDWPRVSAYPRRKNSTHMRMWLSRTNPNCNHCREDPLAHNEGEGIPRSQDV
jgi:hypothetical protein